MADLGAAALVPLGCPGIGVGDGEGLAGQIGPSVREKIIQDL